MAAESITDADARAFADKLTAFGQGLTGAEQILLREILLRADQPEDAEEVEGHHVFVDPPALMQTAQTLHQVAFAWHDMYPHLHSIVHSVITSLPVSHQPEQPQPPMPHRYGV